MTENYHKKKVAFYKQLMTMAKETKKKVPDASQVSMHDETLSAITDKKEKARQEIGNVERNQENFTNSRTCLGGIRVALGRPKPPPITVCTTNHHCTTITTFNTGCASRKNSRTVIQTYQAKTTGTDTNANVRHHSTTTSTIHQNRH